MNYVIRKRLLRKFKEKKRIIVDVLLDIERKKVNRDNKILIGFFVRDKRFNKKEIK